MSEMPNNLEGEIGLTRHDEISMEFAFLRASLIACRREMPVTLVRSKGLAVGGRLNSYCRRAESLGILHMSSLGGY